MAKKNPYSKRDLTNDEIDTAIAIFLDFAANMKASHDECMELFLGHYTSGSLFDASLKKLPKARSLSEKEYKGIFDEQITEHIKRQDLKLEREIEYVTGIMVQLRLMKK